jgi:N-methylhydantoinase A
VVDAETPRLSQLADLSHAVADPPVGSRPVHYPVEGVTVDAAIFRRETLPTGFAHAGACVIEERDCTTVIGPADRFEIGELGEIRIEVGAA